LCLEPFKRRLRVSYTTLQDRWNKADLTTLKKALSYTLSYICPKTLKSKKEIRRHQTPPHQRGRAWRETETSRHSDNDFPNQNTQPVTRPSTATASANTRGIRLRGKQPSARGGCRKPSGVTPSPCRAAHTERSRLLYAAQTLTRVTNADYHLRACMRRLDAILRHSCVMVTTVRAVVMLR
jgi:hypothetical protein